MSPGRLATARARRRRAVCTRLTAGRWSARCWEMERGASLRRVASERSPGSATCWCGRLCPAGWLRGSCRCRWATSTRSQDGCARWGSPSKLGERAAAPGGLRNRRDVAPARLPRCARALPPPPSDWDPGWRALTVDIPADADVRAGCRAARAARHAGTRSASADRAQRCEARPTSVAFDPDEVVCGVGEREGARRGDGAKSAREACPPQATRNAYRWRAWVGRGAVYPRPGCHRSGRDPGLHGWLTWRITEHRPSPVHCARPQPRGSLISMGNPWAPP
jgi:hypothetical protein